jgi:hypothetical protein
MTYKCGKNQNSTNAPKLMTFQKNSYQLDGNYNAFLIHLRLLSPSTFIIFNFITHIMSRV